MGRFPRVTHPSATPVLLQAFDLHVLGMPPAFVLSQDQTLKLTSPVFFEDLGSLQTRDLRRRPGRTDFPLILYFQTRDAGSGSGSLPILPLHHHLRCTVERQVVRPAAARASLPRCSLVKERVRHPTNWPVETSCPCGEGASNTLDPLYCQALVTTLFNFFRSAEKRP